MSRLRSQLLQKLPQTASAWLTVVCCVIVVGLGGTYVVQRSHAATPTAATEVENGTLGDGATKIGDATASGGAAVKFNAAAQTDSCSTSPTLPSIKPTPNNTGVPAGKALTNSGSITVNTDGTVIDGLNVTGSITVNANNVTIKDTKITDPSDYFALNLKGTNATIINNEITTPAGGYTGVLGGNAFICGNNIHGFENAITVTKGNAIIQANYMDKETSNQSAPHNDGVEVYGGNNYKIWGNNILMTDASGNWMSETGAINVAPYGGMTVSNADLRGNWLGGGSFTITLDNSGGAISSLSVVNNRFYGSAPTGFAAYGAIRAPSIISTNTGNVWDATGLGI